MRYRESQKVLFEYSDHSSGNLPLYRKQLPFTEQTTNESCQKPRTTRR